METKKFWKTSEFWIMVLSQAGNFVTAMTGFIDPKTAAMISAVLTFGYGLARGMAKSGVTPNNEQPK